MSTWTPTTAPAALVIADDDAPVRYTRVESVNPFAEKVAAMVADWDTENGRSKRSARVTVPTAKVGSCSRQLRDAARAIGRGIRVNTTEVPGDAASSVIHFQVATLKVGAGRPKGAAKPAATAPVPTAPKRK